MRTSDIPVPRSRTQCSSSRFGSRAASLSRHSPSRRWAVRTAEVSPRRRRRLQTATCAWRRAAGPLPPPPLALQLICGLAGGALGAREARGRGARRRPFCLPRRRSFFFVFCLAAARGASTAAAAAEAAAAAAAEALSEPHRWEARARAGRSRAALLAARPHQRRSGGLLLSLGGTLVRRRCAGTTGRGTLATPPARCGSGLRDVGPRRGRRSCRRPSGGWAASSLPLSSAGGHRGGRTSGAARGPAESAARRGVARPVPVGGHRLRRGGGVPGTTGAWEEAGGGAGRLDRPPRWPALSRACRRYPCLRP